jgi:hypothetical protein
MLNLITGQVSHQSEPGECNMLQDYCPQSKSAKNENEFFFILVKAGFLEYFTWCKYISELHSGSVNRKLCLPTGSLKVHFCRVLKKI